MSDINLISQLQKFGFSNKESVVYLALLELGSSVVSDISKKTSLNRSSTYPVLDSLIKKGIVSISTSDKVKVYTAASPERLVQLAEESMKKFSELVGVARNIVPELKHIYVGAEKKPRVQFFEGIEGLITAYEDTLTSTESIRAYASIENMHLALPDYFPEYYKRRAGKGIHIKSIFPDTNEAEERIKYNKEEDREAYLVPKEEYSFSPEINLYEDKVVMMSLVEKFALIVESAELANALKKGFDLAFSEAKRLHTKKYGQK